MGTQKRHLIFYGWLIVATGMLVQALGYGARYSFSVIFLSLLEHFQWPRDITAAMLSVHMMTYGIVAPVAGGLVDKIGPRRTMGIGATLLALSLTLSAWGDKPWHLYLTFGLLAGAGLCLIGSVLFTTVLRNWFERRRGIALSLLFAGTGAAFGFYPVVAFLITSVGWRNTFLVEAIVIATIILPLLLLIVRYHPRDKGLFRDGVLKASIAQIHGLSAHADRDELLRWLSSLKKPPRHLFVTYGEPQVAESFSHFLREKTGWSISVPEYQAEALLE